MIDEIMWELNMIWKIMWNKKRKKFLVGIFFIKVFGGE